MNGLSIFCNDAKDFIFKQQEEAKLSIKGPLGGLTVASNGNIGVATDNPRQKLHIAEGNLLVSNTPENISNSITGSIILGADRIDPFSQNPFWGIEYLYSNNVTGDILFASIPSTGGMGKEISDTQVKNNIKLQLTSDGILKAKDVLVATTDMPDFVFEKDYPLMSLQETELFIEQNKHLPNIPSAAEVEENGLNLGEMQGKLLQKIEELTLYILDLQKQIDELKTQKP